VLAGESAGCGWRGFAGWGLRDWVRRQAHRDRTILRAKDAVTH
jgi:hypothetical protein